MTETEWPACTDPTPMLDFLRGKASERKLRLYGAACCRAVWDILTDGRARAAVEALEVYVDQPSFSDADWRFVNGEARAAFSAAKTPACQNANSPRTAACAAAYAVVRLCAEDAAAAAIGACYQTVNAVARSRPTEPGFFRSAWEPTYRSRAELLRDQIGNPFCPVAINPNWLTWNDCTVRRIAQVIYDQRAFDRMPILADALEDAGCDNADILDHCRSEGPHVRGCWLVDLLLGKE